MAAFAKAVSTSVVTLSAGGANKKHVSIAYDGPSYLYVIADSVDPSAALYSAKLGGGDSFTYWAPEGTEYRGEIRGVLASGAGTAFVTEYAQ